jgi:hypothetical protein
MNYSFKQSYHKNNVVIEGMTLSIQQKSNFITNNKMDLKQNR